MQPDKAENIKILNQITFFKQKKIGFKDHFYWYFNLKIFVYLNYLKLLAMLQDLSYQYQHNVFSRLTKITITNKSLYIYLFLKKINN